jgi:hypothetical protein
MVKIIIPWCRRACSSKPARFARYGGLGGLGGHVFAARTRCDWLTVITPVLGSGLGSSKKPFTYIIYQKSTPTSLT